ncbi:MAG TPA: sigma-70 family RNA polymerase sigma factor [Kofleriaceae bacterium]|nr:sigma-70 family RNA polymerase sigma factor [Kofleriaceae bacterium]
MIFKQFDEAYLGRLCQGDPEVEAHFAAYFGQLISIKLRRRLKSQHAIDDVRQETFLRVFRILRSASGVQHPERLGALVNSVCNKVLLEASRSRRYEELPEEIASGPTAGGSTDAVNGLISEEQRAEVQKVLAELPERDRSLLRAVYLDEDSRDSICEQFKVDRDYLRVLLHRAKESFRLRYQQGGGQGGGGASPRPLQRSH